MKTRTVKELMVPVSDYATVSRDASLKEAMAALENKNKQHGEAPYRHRSLVVVDDKNYVVGRISQIDIMRALEPKYSEIGDARWMERAQLSKRMLATIREQFQLWDQPVDAMARTMEKTKVADIMQVPAEGEFVHETDTMNIAMHRIVMGHHHSLLVTRDKVIVGILRSTDVFNALYDMIQNAE
jgi:CBS domain-containing protein